MFDHESSSRGQTSAPARHHQPEAPLPPAAPALPPPAPAVLIAAVAVFVANCSASEPDEKDVVVLTPSNFDETIQNSKNVLVEFYSPWCPAVVSRDVVVGPADVCPAVVVCA